MAVAICRPRRSICRAKWRWRKGNLVDAVPVCQLLGEWAERHEPAVPSLSARTDYSFPGQQTAPGASQHTGGIYFDHDPDYIMRMADEAAAPGVERFIIDDGWFKGRNDDWAALGDWYLDEKNTPTA